MLFDIRALPGFCEPDCATASYTSLHFYVSKNCNIDLENIKHDIGTQLDMGIDGLIDLHAPQNIANAYRRLFNDTEINHL